MKRPHVAAAVVGIGESALGRVPNRSSMHLLADAARAAVADAGLTMRDIDGIITVPIRVESWPNPAAIIAAQFGIRPRFLNTINLAGASGTAMIHQAAMAVETGQARHVLCLAGQCLLSGMSRARAITGMAEGGSSHPQFEAPYGPLLPSLYALVAQRHMHEYGTTEAQMAEVAAAIRHHASMNSNAHKREPIDVSEVLSSRMITSPLKLLDCSLVSDGAAAAIVTSTEEARDLPRPPVYLLGQGYGLRHSYIGEARDITESGAVESGREAFASAGLAPRDIDVAQLYDCFTITVLVELEDLGFCPKGEAGRYVEGGRIRVGGDLPITTHGGLLSCAHFGPGSGFLHVLEGVRQLRQECGTRQVPDAQVALVHGNGGIIAVHCTLILGNQFTH